MISSIRPQCTLIPPGLSYCPQKDTPYLCLCLRVPSSGTPLSPLVTSLHICSVPCALFLVPPTDRGRSSVFFRAVHETVSEVPLTRMVVGLKSVVRRS